MTSCKIVVPRHDLEKTRRRVEHEILMCRNEFASSLPRTKKKTPKSSVSACKPTKDKPADKESLTKWATIDCISPTTSPGAPPSSERQRKFKAGEKIRFRRLSKDTKKTDGEDERPTLLEQQNSDSMDESLVVLIRDSTRQRKKCTTTSRSSSERTQVFAARNAPCPDPNYRKVCANPKMKTMSVQNRDTFSIKQPDELIFAFKVETSNDDTAPGRSMQQSNVAVVIPDQDNTKRIEDEDEEESSGGWDTDSGDDSSIDLQHDDDAGFTFKDLKDDSNTSMLTESTISCVSSSGRGDSYSFDSSDKSLLSSSLALGPSAFMETNNGSSQCGNFSPGVDEDKKHGNDPYDYEVDTSSPETKNPAIESETSSPFGSARKPRVDDNIAVETSELIQPSDLAPTTLTADSQHSTISAPGSSQCDLDQLLPYLQQNLSLASVMREKRKPKNTKRSRSSSVQQYSSVSERKGRRKKLHDRGQEPSLASVLEGPNLSDTSIPNQDRQDQEAGNGNECFSGVSVCCGAVGRVLENFQTTEEEEWVHPLHRDEIFCQNKSNRSLNKNISSLVQAFERTGLEPKLDPSCKERHSNLDEGWVHPLYRSFEC